TAPFKITEHKKHISPQFNKNNQYSPQNPKLNKLEPKVKPPAETPFLSIKKAQTNFPYTHHTPTHTLHKHTLKQLKQTPTYQLKPTHPINTKILLLNSANKHTPLTHKPLRQPLPHILNTHKIPQHILHKQQNPATQLFPKNLTHINFNLPTTTYHNKKAQALLHNP
ncbi:ABC transporter substrate-binding protein, partial [Staphylococcus epidermidis]|uniref:ABC transporter substrate-binding protein n=1 Tax=Staphylococcus epidermidis TaxID=1282 RepID=UPI0037D9F17E